MERERRAPAARAGERTPTDAPDRWATHCGTEPSRPAINPAIADVVVGDPDEDELAGARRVSGLENGTPERNRDVRSRVGPGRDRDDR
jgi:hypothetical protein